MRHLVLVAHVFLVGACSPSGEDARTATVRREVFEPTCALVACHESEGAADGLDLMTDNVGARLIDAPSISCPDEVLIVPGDPEGSYLFRKTTDNVPACGERMPPGPVGLDADQTAILREWIEGL